MATESGLPVGKKKRGVLIRVFGIFLCLFAGEMYFLFPPRSWGGEVPPGRSVLLLNTFYRGHARGDALIKGISRTILPEVGLHVEHLDMAGPVFPSRESHHANLIGRKYTEKPDVIITVGGGALGFLMKFRSKLFPEVPVVFCGIEETPEKAAARDKTFGVLETPGEAKTVELALSLHPRRKIVLVSADDTPDGVLRRTRAMGAAARGDGVAVGDFSDPAWRGRMVDHPEKTLLVWLNAAGASLPANAALPASVPVYTVWNYAVGKIAVGGYVSDSISSGIKAGTMARGIIGGQGPGVSREGPFPVFDYPLLKKHELSPGGLPRNAVVKNRDASSPNDSPLPFICLGLTASMALGGAIWIKRIEKREAEIREQGNREWGERLYNEKMWLLERVSGGISHDLRNPLGAIKNAVFFLNMALEDPEPEIGETMEILEKEIVNSERIITSLTEFSRAKAPVMKRVLINELLEDTLGSLRLPERVILDNRVGEMRALSADPDQMETVFRNIIVNAVKSMPKGGRLTFTSEDKGDEMAVAAEDTGPGIAPEHMDRLFEPFFTTRAKGIGLGLTITREMVKENGGRIEVESRPGTGSTFTVILPVARPLGKSRPRGV